MSRRVLRRTEWAWPSQPVHLEVLTRTVESDRPALLFVPGLGHGAWCFAQHWQEAAADRGYSSHAMSLRGHGGSGGASRLRRTTMRDYVHDVLQVVASLPEPPVIVGHSMGSLVAQRVVQRYPARAAVLLTPIPANGIPGTVIQGMRTKPLDFTRAVLGASLRLREKDLFAQLPSDQARTYVSRIGPESPWAQYAMLRPESLGQVDCPVLVVGAREDALVATSDVQRCAASLSTSAVWVPGGHDVMLDGSWHEALMVVLDWIDKVCPPGAPLPGAREVPALDLFG